MGINRHTLALIRQCASLKRVATIGRQSFNASAKYDYLDEYLKAEAGTEDVVVIDNSAFEGAGFVADLNEPVPSELINRFDVVIDGGAMEHIFDVKTCMTNYMRMVKVGGSVVIATTANNHFGHGFYQFDSEFFYRVFSPENGFELKDCLLGEHSFPSGEISPRWKMLRTVDPKDTGGRVQFVNNKPVLIFVRAEKIADVEPFRTNPQQSDYAAAWANGKPTAPQSRAKELVKAIPFASVRNRLFGAYQLSRMSLGNKRWFKPLRP